MQECRLCQKEHKTHQNAEKFSVFFAMKSSYQYFQEQVSLLIYLLLSNSLNMVLQSCSVALDLIKTHSGIC